MSSKMENPNLGFSSNFSNFGKLIIIYGAVGKLSPSADKKGIGKFSPGYAGTRIKANGRTIETVQ